MPRIDPLQLLRCLSVLLSPTGGIKSQEEVQRLASLMTKFSKKLVSKCIYIRILTTTRSDLLGMFMAAGGWNLTHTWLSDAIIAKNWPLITELLELLLMCPVDIERLKTNNCPKLIKGLSKDFSNEKVQQLALKLVEQWLKIVKGENVDSQVNCVNSEVKQPETIEQPKVSSVSVQEEQLACKDPYIESVDEPKGNDSAHESNVEETSPTNTDVDKDTVKEIKTPSEAGTSEDSSEETNNWNTPLGQLPVYKITIRDGKQVLAKVSAVDRSKKSESPKSDKSGSSAPKQNENVEVNKTDDSLNKLTAEPKLSILKPKVRIDRLETLPNDLKLNKESIKKNKENQSSSKPDKKLKVDIVKEKVKESSRTKEKHKEKERDRDKERKEKLKEKGKDKDKEKEKLKDKDSDNEKNKDKEIKDKKGESDKDLADKDKATLAKLIPPPISKLGKIPKKVHNDETLKTPEVKPNSEVKKSPENRKITYPEPKKSSISIEVRKPMGDSRPKTVKMYNSKFRSTGLEEEVKPPPSRIVKKVGMPEKKPIKMPTIKRPSPPKDVGPPEKKAKPGFLDACDDSKKNEKAGAIKLIPPKPKQPFLQESDMFMDALTASTKKEPRKRKRRISSSKDGPDPKKEPNGKDDEVAKDTTPPISPTVEEKQQNFKPTFKFYQDTLETDEDKSSDDIKETVGNVKMDADNTQGDSLKGSSNVENEADETSKDSSEDIDDIKIEIKEEMLNENMDLAIRDTTSNNKFMKGVLIYHKLRRGPKKSVRWKTDKDLEDIRYFELDETERVNVTKTFMDMKQMERSNEREAFLLARKLPQDDIMEEKTSWQPLIPIEIPNNLVEPGKNSREKDIQYAREKVTLQAIYFSRNMIPDSPAEPDLEVHTSTDIVIIPLEDITGNPDSINDFQNTPWPEPKPMMAPSSPPIQFQPSQPQFTTYQPHAPHFTPVPQQFPPQVNMPNNMGPGPGPGVGLLMTPNTMPSPGGDWRTGDGKIVPVNDMPMQMDMYSQPVGPMGMGMPPQMPNPQMPNPQMPNPQMPNPQMNPEMGFNMMGEEMNQGGPYPMQGFPMNGPPNMFPPFMGNQGHGMPPPANRGHMHGRGRGQGHWFRPPMGGGGGNWQRGGGRGGRGSWNGPSRTVCKHFRNGYCRQGDKCPFLHPQY